MSGRTHAIVPAACTALLFNADPLLTLTAAIAGLLPDLDEPWSVIGQRFWILAWWMKYLFGHRTISHSLLMVVVSGVLGMVLVTPPAVTVAVMMGLGSHVILDAMSGGVQLWWPSKRRWVLGRCPVYGLMDRCLLLGGIVVYLGTFMVRLETEIAPGKTLIGSGVRSETRVVLEQVEGLRHR